MKNLNNSTEDSILNFRLLPPKLMREWKSLFVAGKPLFEVAAPVESTDPTPEQVLEEERQHLLDEGDFLEYKVRKVYFKLLMMSAEQQLNIFLVQSYT